MPPEFDVPAVFLQRMSPHFLLIDFMQDRTTMTLGRPLVLDPQDLYPDLTFDGLNQLAHLCHSVLEPMLTRFGPCSVACGFRANPVYGAPPMRDSPHRYNNIRGAAADVVFHDWVRPTLDFPYGRDPVGMLNHVQDLPISRWISYAGTEFTCVASLVGSRRRSVSLNIRRGPFRKPWFQTIPLPDAQRYDQHGWPMVEKWRRRRAEPIFHTRRTLRPQHIRVGRYFTLLDFSHSPDALLAGVHSALPLSAFQQITSARQAAFLLDPLVQRLGRLTVVRGVEPMSIAAERRPEHLWRGDGDRQVLVAFAAHVQESHLADWTPPSRIRAELRLHRARPDLLLGALRWHPFSRREMFLHTSAGVQPGASIAERLAHVEEDILAAAQIERKASEAHIEGRTRSARQSQPVRPEQRAVLPPPPSDEPELPLDEP